jgi:hypothetical protein
MEVVQAHMGWILEADPEAGVEALLQLGPALPPSAALALLQRHAPALRGAYLELALKLGVAAPQQFHSELLLIYLEEALLEDQQARQQQGWLQQGEGDEVLEPGTPPAHEGSGGSGTPGTPSPGTPSPQPQVTAHAAAAGASGALEGARHSCAPAQAGTHPCPGLRWGL